MTLRGRMRKRGPARIHTDACTRVHREERDDTRGIYRCGFKGHLCHDNPAADLTRLRVTRERTMRSLEPLIGCVLALNRMCAVVAFDILYLSVATPPRRCLTHAAFRDLYQRWRSITSIPWIGSHRTKVANPHTASVRKSVKSSRSKMLKIITRKGDSLWTVQRQEDVCDKSRRIFL